MVILNLEYKRFNMFIVVNKGIWLNESFIKV